MQSVASGWTAESRDPVRYPVQNTRVSWKRQSTLGARTFTIGVSLIGGNDLIGANPGAIGSPGNYRYFDESVYVTSLAWERGLSMPTGGLTKALAEVKLDNTSGRFTPRYMGGRSELFTAVLPRRPVIINAGFNYGGVDQTLPQFAGILNKQPRVDVREGEVELEAADYIDFFQGRYLDKEVMFTSQRTDEVMETLLTGTLGMSTSQFDLDYGINLIPFGLFEVGTRMSDIFNQLSQAEAGHFYQDESGIFKFRNRQWGDSSPYNSVQRILLTGQVISAEAPNDDHIINVVEINSKSYAKQPEQIIFRLAAFDSILIEGNSTEAVFVQFDNPALSMTTPTSTGQNSYFVGNLASDGSSTNLTSSLSVNRVDRFAHSAKIYFTNSSPSNVYITNLVITGRTAVPEKTINTRAEDDSSVTAFQEQPLLVNNDFIQNQSWAESYAQLILNDYSDPENLQKIVIRALPELQPFDLISWQGRYWRIYNIRTQFDPSYGYTQELTLLQRTITTYFRIGISTIGGSDKIAP